MDGYRDRQRGGDELEAPSDLDVGQIAGDMDMEEDDRAPMPDMEEELDLEGEGAEPTPKEIMDKLISIEDKINELVGGDIAPEVEAGTSDLEGDIYDDEEVAGEEALDEMPDALKDEGSAYY